MSTRQNKKRKGRNQVNNRERTVTTFTEDPNTSFLVPLSSEESPTQFSPSSFSMSYQNYIQPQFYHPVLPPGKNDLEILENLKTIIKEGQHEFYRAVPQPAALAALYLGSIPHQQDYHPSTEDSTTPQSTINTTEVLTPLSAVDTSPSKLSAEHFDSDDSARMTTQDPLTNTNTDTTGEYGSVQPVDTVSSTNNNNNDPPPDAPKDDAPFQSADENAWKRSRYDSPNVPQSEHNSNDARPSNGASTTPPEARFPPQEDRRSFDRDQDKDRNRLVDRDRDRDWVRDNDRNDATRDRDRDRPTIRDRRPEFFGRSYGRSHAPRPPPELRHYEPSYGPDYVPPRRRFDPDDRRGAPRNPPVDDRFKPPPFDDRKSPYDDRLPPLPPADDGLRLPLDDRPIRPLPGSDTRPLPPSPEDRTRPPGDPVPLSRATKENDRDGPATSLAADDRPRATVSLEERLSQPVSAPSLQDRLSQPVVPPRLDVAPAPSLEERLSVGPVPPRPYGRAPSLARDDLRPPLFKDDLRDHDRISDFRTNRDFSRERPGGPLATASTYRPDLDRGFPDRDDPRDRRDRDVPPDVNAPPPRFGDVFNRAGPPPPRRYSPPPHMFDRDRDRDRGRQFYPARSPPPPPTPPSFRGDGMYDPDGERRYTNDRGRDAYEQQRRRDWYPSDFDKRGLLPPPPPPPSASWRPPPEKAPFIDGRERDRFETRERDRDRDRDVREHDRDRERARDLGGWSSSWDDRDRRAGFPPHSPGPLHPPPPHSLPDARMDSAPGRSLSARLTDPYPPTPGSGPGDDRGAPYPPPRDFERGRYGAHALDSHPPPPPFSRIRNRSLSPPRRGPGLADDLRPPPMKRAREDHGSGYAGMGGPRYSPPRRGGVGVGGGMGTGAGNSGAGGGGEYVPGPPPSSAATTATTGTVTSVVTSVSGTVPPRSAGTRTPPVSAPPSSAGGAGPGSGPGGGGFYERGVGDREREQRERDRERERDWGREREREKDRGDYMRGEYGMGMGYDRPGPGPGPGVGDGRGRRSPPPPMLGSRMGPPVNMNGPGPGPSGGGGYGRGGVVGDRRDDRRYVPPPPPLRTG